MAPGLWPLGSPKSFSAAEERRRWPRGSEPCSSRVPASDVRGAPGAVGLHPDSGCRRRPRGLPQEGPRAAWHLPLTSPWWDYPTQPRRAQTRGHGEGARHLSWPLGLEKLLALRPERRRRVADRERLAWVPDAASKLPALRPRKRRAVGDARRAIRASDVTSRFPMPRPERRRGIQAADAPSRKPAGRRGSGTLRLSLRCGVRAPDALSRKTAGRRKPRRPVQARDAPSKLAMQHRKLTTLRPRRRWAVVDLCAPSDLAARHRQGKMRRRREGSSQRWRPRGRTGCRNPGRGQGSFAASLSVGTDFG
jgi:hypothetical protein